MKRSVIFLIVVSMIALFFFGCRHGGNGSFIKKEAERQIISKSGIVSDDGSLAPIVFPSGATIKAPEANTMKYGVKVTVTEEKVPNNQDSALGSASELYVYSVTAKLYSDNPLESPVPVTTLEKPFTFTIPNNVSDRGTCYIGVREDPDSPWRYFRASDQNMVIANYMSERLLYTAPKEVTLTLYRAGIQITLFVLDTSKSILSTVDITESIIEEPLVTKKDYYQSDLKLSSTLKGTGLNKLKSSDLSVRITFDSDIANLTNFKVDGSSYNLNISDNKAATGGKYAYSFEGKNVTIKNQSDTELDFDLVLNTDKMSVEDFNQGFLMEIYSVTDNKEILPFIYSQYVTYETVEAPTEYLIEYNLDGGIVAEENPVCYYTASETITLNNPTKEGYTFIGWTGSNGDVPQITVTIEQDSTGDRTYTANWSEVAYTITYNLDGGMVTPANPTGYNIASETFVLNEPTKEGYTFLGWTGSNGDVPQKSLSIVQGSTSNLSFTANWSINSYRLDIVKGTGINNVTGDGIHEYNSSVTASCTMLTGYEFDKWTGDITTETFNMPAANATMTANAKLIVYNITYGGIDGATFATANPTTYDVTSATINLNEPTKTGYTFLGWTGSNGDVPQKLVSIVHSSTSDLSFTANWSINSYRLDIVKGTGIKTVTGDGLRKYNSSVTASCTMLAGYEFDKWTGDITTETFNMPAANATMTANAKLINYTITYDLNGGTLAEGDSNPEYYNITSPTILLNNPTKVGTYFMGWTSDDFFGASMTIMIPQGSSGNRIFTANWGEVKTFTLTNGVTLVMHKIPAGTFNMGSPVDELDRISYETLHQVTISQDFYMGKFEVTQDQYFAVKSTNPSSFKEGLAANEKPTTSANYPVDLVSWNEIASGSECFLNKINDQLATQLPSGYKFDLPTEAQWEYACRAGTSTSLNNNTNITKANGTCPNLGLVGWYSAISVGKTHDVGGKASNDWGLYDMHGNVWEWCKDWHKIDYYTTCDDFTDPQGPDTGLERIYRGGGYYTSPGGCRSAYRIGGHPTGGYVGLGFRLVLVKTP